MKLERKHAYYYKTEFWCSKMSVILDDHKDHFCL